MDPRKVVNESTGGGEEARRRPDARPDPLVSKVIADKYRVLDLIAQGGMGRIYRAEQLPLGRIVALKILRPQKAFDSPDDTWKKRFLLEAATCARLTHPNTVTLFDYGQITLGSRSTFFMVMELVPGRTLADALRSDGPFDPRRTLHVASEICRSLQEAHQLGIVHRDLKPSNVMLIRRDDGESVKVLDFGVAKVLEEDSEALTQADSVVGSPRYMSPEQIRHLDLDGRSDLYSLGVLLYLMLSGQVPFARDSAVGTLMAHLTEPAPSIVERTGRVVPESVEALVRRCLEKNPKDRFPNAGALREAIEAVLDSLPDEDLPDVAVQALPSSPISLHDDTSQTTLSVVKTNTSPVAAVTPTPADRRWLPLAVVSVLALIGLIAFLALRDKGPEAQPELVAAPEATPPKEVAVLALSSEPAGAEIYEGASLLGVAPLSIPLNTPDSRTFELRLSGYKSATLKVAPDTTELTRAVKLDKQAAAPPRTQAPRTPEARPNPPPSTPPQTTVRPKGHDLGIIDER